MAETRSVGARILAAQASLCSRLAAELAEAQASGASPEDLADLEAQELAARRRYQELSVDMPSTRQMLGTGVRFKGRRPWWRFW
jgi:hypothetical protein